jgi:hypothetical protein
MLVVPISAERYLRHVVDAAESSGYSGLLLVLARTADAREQHEELLRDWTSLHDVTGPMLAVVCPDPEAIRESAVQIASNAGFVNVPGLRVNHPSQREESRFGRHFSRPTDWQLRDDVDEMRCYLRDYARARPTHDELTHQAAFSEAVSRCSSYFGISESQLPALLFLSFWERVAVLVPVRPDLSLYRLVKAVVGAVEVELATIIEADAEQERIENSLAAARLRLKKRQPFDLWSQKVKTLIRELAESEDIFGEELVGACVKQLEDMLKSGALGELRGLLYDVHRRAADSRSLTVRHSSVWGILQVVESGNLPARDPDWEGPEILELKLTDAISTNSRLRTQVRLSERILEQAKQLRANVVLARGRAALQGWELRTVDWVTMPQVVSERSKG